MKKMKKFVLAIMICSLVGVVASQDVKAEITNFPNGLSSWGVPVLPNVSSGIFADSNVYWVDSTDSQNADGAGGGTAEQPFATIDFAVGQCTANNGDLILVKPGHTETVSAAAGLDFDVAGITIIGIGTGSDRPTVDFTTAATADIDIDAANVTIVNILFEARVEGLTAPVDINAADCRLFNIETRDIDAIGSTTAFIVTDANADRLLIDGWKHVGTATGGTDASSNAHPISAVSLIGGDDIVIRNVNLYGDFGRAGILATTTGCTRLTVGGFDQHSQIWTENSSDTCVAVMDSTGFIGPNLSLRLEDDAANTRGAATGTAAQFMQPIIIVNADAESSTQTTITPTGAL